METTLPTIGTSAEFLAPAHLKNAASQNTDASINLSAKSDRSFGNILTTVLSCTFAATLMAVLLETILGADALPGQIARNFVDSFIYSNCIGMLVGFAVFGFTPWLMLRRFLNWVLLICMILSLTFVGSLAAGFILMGLRIFPAHDYGWISLRRMGLGFLLGLVFGISGYLYERVRLRLKTTTEQLRLKVLEKERAQKLAVVASLSSLESRIHPHFLFNTLNSISSLIEEDPLLAERMVERLAALLRFALDSSERSTIPLEQELKIAIDYLEIEKTRFGERLQFDIAVSDEVDTVLVPPFVIQTLVENSVKHAVSVRPKGGRLYLKVSASGDEMNIEVGDDGPGFTEDAIRVGHGLDNLRARLAALYSGEATLELLSRGSLTVVKVSMPNHSTLRSEAV